MEIAYRFKLIPNQAQEQAMTSWRPMVRSMVNYALRDRINTYAQSFAEGPFCNLASKSEAWPLTCSVNRSASLGEPWKIDNPKLRRGKIKGPYCDLQTRQEKSAFNPRRSAFEMQSSNLPILKENRPWYQAVNADVLQQALKHLDTAFQRFFTGKSKFPQFKQKTDISFEFKPGTVRIDGARIKLPTLGWMRFFKSREIPESWEIRTVTITGEADGWYASILLRDKTVPSPPKKRPEELSTVNGVDRGIKKLTAEANGRLTPNPQIGKRFERRLEIRQRRLSRKKKGSKNRAKAGNRVARVHQKIKRVRDDFQWKLAKQLASSADVIGFEDLNIMGMKARCKPQQDEATGKFIENGQAAKRGLNKAISDAAWYSLYLKTKHQASKLGNWVEEVNARHSSQECSECGFVSPTNRDKEKFVCERCGHHDDADIDAGVVIAKRTIEKLGIEVAVVSREFTPKPESTGSRKRENKTPLGLLGGPGNLDCNGQTRDIIQLTLFGSNVGQEYSGRDDPGESPSIAQSA